MIVKNPKADTNTFASSTKMGVEVAHDIASLAKHVEAWQELAADAVEPNTFYEPWMLIPAIRAFGADADLMFVFVYARPDSDRPTLCGFFPMERKRRFRGLPIPYLALWRHLHCHIATPLVRDNMVAKTMRTFFEWIRQNQRGCPLLELPSISGDGPLVQSLVSEIWPVDCYIRSYTRAMIRTREGVDEYLAAALSGDGRRELRRRQRRLDERGKIELMRTEPDDNPQTGIDQFLQLEASGWKGEQGVAMVCDEADREFFTEVCLAGLKRRQLTLSSLSLDARPIAMTCDLLSAPGCFAFKTAYDEESASFAPGIRLTLDNIGFIHSRSEFEWMDSCTTANSTWLRKLWSDQKTVSSYLIPTGSRGSGLAVAMFPLFRWLRRTVTKE